MHLLSSKALTSLMKGEWPHFQRSCPATRCVSWFRSMHAEQQQECLYSCGVFIATHGAGKNLSQTYAALQKMKRWNGVHLQTTTLMARDRARIGHMRSAVAWMTRTVFRIIRGQSSRTAFLNADPSVNPKLRTIDPEPLTGLRERGPS